MQIVCSCSIRQKSVKCGLADTLIYRNDVRNYLKKLVEINEDDNLPILGLGDMMNVRKNVPKDKSGNIVAVYYASGEITDYPSSATSEDGIVGSKVIRDLRKLKDNDDVKAVVLRVNSPWKCFRLGTNLACCERAENKETGHCLYG